MLPCKIPFRMLGRTLGCNVKQGPIQLAVLIGLGMALFLLTNVNFLQRGSSYKSEYIGGILVKRHLEGHMVGNMSQGVIQGVQHVFSGNDSVKKNYSEIYTDLEEGLITPSIHYMWCGHGWFKYREYLSVISVVKAMNTDKIIIHYEYHPKMDDMIYHQWLDYLKQDVPFLKMEKMDDKTVKFCYGDRDTQISIILEILNKEGGLFLQYNTWLLNFPPLKRSMDFEFALDDLNLDGYILMRRGLLNKKRKSYIDLLQDKSLKTRTTFCGKIHHIYHGHSNTEGCITVSGGRWNSFYPKDIWELDDPFGRLTRRIFYGTTEIRKPKPSYDELVPNIGHMIWYGGGEMDYVYFLSLLSMLFIVKVDVLYIHGDYPPAGPYWDFINATPRIRSRIKIIQRSAPDHVYQGFIEDWYPVLKSDITRVDLMIKYGGVYADTDAIWVKGLTMEDRGYDATASFDWVDWSWPYPDSINFGLMYGKRNAKFWHLLRDSFRKVNNQLHGFNCCMNPYKILERYPELLRIDRHLQVICYESRCHPIWIPGYQNESRDHITDNSLTNWKQDAYALHWTNPNPKELKDEATLRNSTGLFADVGKYVLQMAGLW